MKSKMKAGCIITMIGAMLLTGCSGSESDHSSTTSTPTEAKTKESFHSSTTSALTEAKTEESFHSSTTSAPTEAKTEEGFHSSTTSAPIEAVTTEGVEPGGEGTGPTNDTSVQKEETPPYEGKTAQKEKN